MRALEWFSASGLCGLRACSVHPEVSGGRFWSIVSLLFAFLDVGGFISELDPCAICLIDAFAFGSFFISISSTCATLWPFWKKIFSVMDSKEFVVEWYARELLI